MATFYNQATLSYNGTVASSNITSGEILEVLSAEKDAVSDSYSQESENVYMISIVNSGSVCYNGLTVTDDLGAYSFGEDGDIAVPLTYREESLVYYVNGVKQPEPVVTSLSPLTVTGINVPAGGNAMLVYAASANSFAPMGTDADIKNTAVISGAGFDPVTVSETISYSDGIELAISKSLSPAAVEENGEVTYTFIIQNFGTASAETADNVIFSDTFTPSLSGLTAEFNGTPWTSGTNYAYDPDTGVFTSLDGEVTVPAASFTQSDTTGVWSVQAGVSTLVIKGRLS
ncbi:MAG: hypothetical protein J5724_05745 [Ruminococcus sp.]|uniref:hypothetical protein n=1 Tax=Ruminococcus sp. TaxID=41978 RepID=UPI001B749723|nr:hypothetical protein [Ruminococcus sp.]MBO4493874.1 hypothetical protein [Ruminococcus sp.]MBP5433795.1 hypothetical protein [Ruminococcus sp.]